MAYKLEQLHPNTIENSYIHYYLDCNLKIVKITGDPSSLSRPPMLPLGYLISEVDNELATKLKALIHDNNVNSAEFSAESPIYNLGFFERPLNDESAFFKLLQLSGKNEGGCVYLLEYSTHAEVFTLDLIDQSVMENIEVLRFKDIIKSSSIGVLQIDDHWRTLYASKTWSEMTGFNLNEVAGREWVQILYPEDRNTFLETLHKNTKLQKNSEQDLRIITAHGGVKWYNIHYRVTYDTLTECSSIVLIFLDVHERRKNQNHLKKIATTDLLTHLGNRYAFQEELEKYIRQLHSNQSFHLLFIDLDGFKAINDAYGHHIGDRLLAETARRISSLVGISNFVARLGGDEFAILRSYANKTEIEEFASKLLYEISRPYSLIDDAHESYISASIGIVGIQPTDIPYEQTLKSEHVSEICIRLLREADAAMYQAKDAGKNTYRFYASYLNEQAIKNQLLSDALHRALDKNQFRLHYQPQWDINSGTLYGYEALIRWRRGNQDISPSEFIPLIESNGLMSEVGKWVFDKALSDHSKILDVHSITPQLSVNFSPIQFRDHKLSSFIKESLKWSNIPASSVTIEVTESLLIADYIEVKKQLESLKAMGLKIALDDFGTGYSSLSNLHSFPIDIIKVDQSFTKSLASHDTRQIVRAIIKMSNELRKTILFEGVETPQQLDFLKSEGVNLIQGWFISKAITLGDLNHFIQQRDTVCP